MARLWYVKDTDGVIGGFTDDNTTAPTGYTATTIADDAAGVPDEGVTAGSIWDAATSTYTARSGVGVTTQFDETTDLGRKKAAAQAHHNQLLAWAIGVALVAHEKPQIDVARAYQFLAMAHWANYVVAHMTTITADQFIAWSQAASIGSSDLTDVQSYFESAHALDEINIPLEACTWANPSTAERVTLSTARMSSTKSGTPESTSYFFGETFDLTSVTLGNGAWIEDITS